MSARICKVHECWNIAHAKNLCGKHYAQVLRYGKVLPRSKYDDNEIIIGDTNAEIVIENKRHEVVARVLIDTEDVNKLKKFKWCVFKRNKNRPYYPSTTVRGKTHYLANILMGFKSNNRIMIDHIDRNPLNNQKSNLRICTVSQNGCNRGKNKNNTSGYKGVYLKPNGKWNAVIGTNGQYINLGTFSEKVDAARAYNDAALLYHGEFSYLNTI